MPDRENLLAQLKQADLISRGDFKLAAGHKSDIYVNMRKAYGDPALLVEIAEAIWDKLDPETTCIAAEGLGGIPLATTLAIRFDFSLTLVRKEVKDHGLQLQIEGYVPNPQDLVALVDDTFSTGTSLTGVIEALKPTQAKIEGAYTIISRGTSHLPVPHHYLYTLAELIS